ncbi:MAG: type 4a pilus biogenesis protein PilO [Pseudomonadota bacterium]
MKLSDLQNLDPSNIGGWPTPIKAVVILVLCAAVLGAGYWFDTQHQIAKLDGVKGEEQQLKTQFETKQAKAANLEPLTEQLAEMKESFGALHRLLPNKTEIEGLLVDISQSGLASGLEFELFKPESEVPEEFYAIQPIKIRVTGEYHEFGEFISAVAALPRIVTQHNIAIRPVSIEEQQELVMELTAKTYRYLEEDEATDAEQN